MDKNNPEKIGKRLKKIVKGKVMWDKVSRYLYATDASIYKVMPLCIVQPKNSKDVQKVVEFCKNNNLTIHPRGAGSGLGGQALGEGVILDFVR